jgi:hypothetical protein
VKVASWRNATFALLVICGVQRFNACTRHRPAAAALDENGEVAESRPSLFASKVAPALSTAMMGVALPTTAQKPMTFHGVKIPPMIAKLLPQSGEKMRAYRDRVLPLAETMITPQRARVARMREELSLAPAQRAALDSNVTATATVIENRIIAGIASGEIDPHALTPMGGVAVARDVLDAIDHGNQQFQSSLTADQRAALGPLHFDFADYFVFSAPWEDALKFLD